MKRRFVLGVLKVHFAELDFAAHRLGQWVRLGDVLSLLRGVEDVEHPLAAGPGGLEHLVEPVQFADRLIKQREIKQERHQLTDGHFVIHHLAAADPQHKAGAARGDETHRRVVERPGAHDGERALAHRLGAVGEALVFVLFAAERLDLTDTLQVVHQQRIHGARGLALLAVAPVRGERVTHCADGEQRDRDHCHAGKYRVGGEQNRQHAEDADDGDGALLGAVDEQPLDGVDVLDHARHQVARGALVIVAHRQPLQSAVHVAPHVEHHVLLEVIVHLDADAVEEISKKKRPQ